ncbi:MAG: D-alanyl-D-alanine carboxypeptidase/D-alanyl-D-alanine-endopeptidase, partial [Acidimicrobiia bacterium]|nr:D-alanyl-D-alanine carboxypeptidase/D-alanyl-D-alanine-endopeptidase [Acidimicrobiia bacterium]
SLESLAQAVRSAGITRVTGDLVIDESRYDTVRRHQSWSLFVAPEWVGSLSAVMVDENRWSAEASFLADPALGNGVLFRSALARAGVVVEGAIGVGQATTPVHPVASVESPPMADLVAEMMTESNNTYAEMLVKEIGWATSGVGSTQAGLTAIQEALRPWCLEPDILQNDGSGLSNGNFRPVRSWRLLLSAAHQAEWWPDFVDSLAVAGQTGTLQWRFRNTAAQGNLRAKTGTISGVRALSGTMETADGREVVFSAIIHDRDQPRRAFTAVDDLLVALANWPEPPDAEPES